MTGLMGSIGLILVVFGISTWRTGLNPVTLALIGLPASAAVHTVQDMRQVREERLYEMNNLEAQSADSEYAIEEAVPVEPYGAPAVETVSTNCPKYNSITGTWQYTHIFKNGLEVAEMAPSDTLVLENTLRFRYDIEALKKHSQGAFSLIEQDNKCAFVFMYQAEDGVNYQQTRTFQIEYIDRDSLCISEGPMTFEYRRK